MTKTGVYGSMSGMAVTPEVDWPKQSWFLRGPLLSTLVTGIGLLALATELSVMLIAGDDPLSYLGLGLSLFGLISINFHRWVGLLATVAGSVASALYATEYVGIWTVTVFAMFLFAKQGNAVLKAVTATALPLYVVLIARVGWEYTDPTALIAVSFCVAAATAGSAVRLQTASWDAARQRAIDLAASQALEMKRAVSAERLRIARDLHDVVGHELAVVNVSVGVAEVSLPSDSEDALAALHNARSGLQRALGEMQQILALLRAGETSDDEPRAELAQLDHVRSLIDRVSSAGISVEATIPDEFPEVDLDVSAAAYRIVQESLTNAQRYGTAPVTLRIESATDRLVIDVQNRLASPGPVESAERAKYGLVGMRERALSAGGQIDISRADGKFFVHVELPTKASVEHNPSSDR